MNSMVRSLAQRLLHRPAVRDRLQRAAAAAGGNKNMQAVAAAYSTAERLAAYRYMRGDGGYLLVPALVVFGAGTWLIATAATRYLMTPPHQRRTTTTTTTVVEGPNAEVAAASPSN